MLHRPVAVEHRLAELSLFRSCNARELRRVDQLSTRVHVAADRQIRGHHDIGREFFVVLDGVLVVTRDRATLSTLASGDWFGERGRAQGCRQNAAVRTLTPATLVVFNLREYNSMRATCPSVRAVLDHALRHRQWSVTFDDQPIAAEAAQVAQSAG